MIRFFYDEKAFVLIVISFVSEFYGKQLVFRFHVFVLYRQAELNSLED